MNRINEHEKHTSGNQARRHGYVTSLAWTVLLAVLLSLSTPGAKADLMLAIQPILTEEKTRTAYQPLADYLGKVVGQKIMIHTSPNFLAYWGNLRSEKFDLVLDAAHFTDYRVQKLGYEVLAKVPDFVSYSLIVLEENLIFDALELAARRVATLGPPSIGAARLNAMFPNPMRQPVIIEVSSSEDGIDMLLKGKVFAAMIPTPLVRQVMAGGAPVLVVTTTDPIPHIAVSASPQLDPGVREAMRKALVTADKSAAGKKMLDDIGFPKFDPASRVIYNGNANLLKEYWGY